MDKNDSTAKTSSAYISNKTIIVAGAGIAGLSFTLSLRKQLRQLGSTARVTVRTYERDAKDDDSREGYSLSVRSDANSGGMQVLNKLDLLGSLLQKSSTGGKRTGSFTFWSTDWKVIFQPKATSMDPDLPAPSMRIARNALRHGLIDAMAPEDVIFWSTACVEAHQLDNGKVRVKLENGEEDECDILIVADGSSSKLRAQLRPGDDLHFAGAVLICATARLPDGVPAPVDLNYGAILSGSGTGSFVAPITEKSAVWSVSYLSPEPRPQMKGPLSDKQVDALIEEALQRGKDFQEPFQTLVKATDPSTLMVFNARDKQPFAHSPDSSIIFLGDSNHAMSPFAGNGANMAMMDGWELAEQLCSCDSLETALKAYNASSIPRSKQAIQLSHQSISIAHAQGWKLALFKAFFSVMSWFQS